MNCGLLAFFTHTVSGNEPSLCLWRILYSGERSSRRVWAIWFMMLSTVCFLSFISFFKKKKINKLCTWNGNSLTLLPRKSFNYFCRSTGLHYGKWGCQGECQVAEALPSWQTNLTMNSIVFTFFISQGSRSILQGPGPCRQDVSSCIIVGSSGETSESYCTKHTYSCKRGTLLRMNFFLNWI